MRGKDGRKGDIPGMSTAREKRTEPVEVGWFRITIICELKKNFDHSG